MTQAPETTGAIGFLTIPALLKDLCERKTTGQLIASRGETVKTVLLKSGAVVYAHSNLESDRLGDILLSRSMISRGNYEESVRQIRETGRKQGTVLVQIGALTPKDLFRGLIFQVREIVLSLFGWSEGRFQFLEGLPPPEETVSLRLQPSGLIFEGLARLAGDRRFREVWNPGALRLTLPPSPTVSLDELECPVAAKHLLALVAQGKPWSAIPQLLGCGEAEAATLLYGLALFGLVQATGWTLEAPPLAPVPDPASPGAPAAAPDEEIILLREKIRELVVKLPKLNFYQLLGLTPRVDQDTIKRSYIALAKEYHPDRFFRPAFEDIQEQINTIFMRINEAYVTLNNPLAREQYDKEVIHLTATAPPRDESEKDSHLAQEQFKKGLSLLNAGDLWSAIESFRWAVKLKPQNPRYHTYLGVTLTRTKKRLHEAEEHCKTAIALDYNNSQYYVHLGQVYKTGHLFEKAKKQFEMALKLDPKHPQALKELEELKGLQH